MSRFDRPTVATRFRFRGVLIPLAVIGLLVADANVLACAESIPARLRSAWKHGPLTAKQWSIAGRVPVPATADDNVITVVFEVAGRIGTWIDTPALRLDQTADQILESIKRNCTRINDSRH